MEAGGKGQGHKNKLVNQIYYLAKVIEKIDKPGTDYRAYLSPIQPEQQHGEGAKTELPLDCIEQAIANAAKSPDTPPK